MARTVFALPVIPADEYQAFRDAIGRNLPESYDEWSSSFADEIAEARRLGASIVNVEVELDEFMAFCATTGKKPDPQVLLDFAVKKIPRDKK